MTRNIVLLSFILLVGCVSRPVEEMSLAEVAVKAAQKSKADTYSPDFFRKAENYFLRARQDYKDGYFDSSRKYAVEARVFAEKAEYDALKKQVRSKDMEILDERDTSSIPSSEAP